MRFRVDKMMQEIRVELVDRYGPVPEPVENLFEVAGLPPPDLRAPFAPQTREAIAAWALGKTRKQLDALAAQHDIPLHTLSN